MKKYNCGVIINEIEVCILSDSDHSNAFVINGTIWNSFVNMRDFKHALIDSLLLEGYPHAEYLAKQFMPALKSQIKKSS